jgi:predicted transcriptional regulator
MPTKPRQFRLADETMRKIDELAAIQGGTHSPAPRAVVIRRAIDFMHRDYTYKASVEPAKVKKKKS